MGNDVMNYVLKYDGYDFSIYKLDTNDEGFNYIDYYEEPIFVTKNPLEAINKFYEIEKEK